jgi:hypothetical protein
MKSLALALTLTAPLASLACTGGERNQDGCPPDEECSPRTPYGMHFTGVSLVGVPLLANPKTTAVGGTQSIGLWKELASGEIVELDLPFDAMTDNGDALAIMGEGPNQVVLRGTGTGADLLRITEEGNDLLYDRYEVAAAALDRVELVPLHETYDDTTPIAFYTGDFSFGLALHAANGERLADDSMTLTFPGPQPSRSDWDTFSLTGVGPGTLSGTLTVAGMPGTIALEVVDAIDAVEPLSDSFPDTITVNSQGEVCFTATAGPAGSVIGVPWNFSASGAVTTVITLSANCMALQVNAPGQFTVHAEALGQSTDVVFTAVAPAKPAPLAPAVAPLPAEIQGDARGERARLLAD